MTPSILTKLNWGARFLKFPEDQMRAIICDDVRVLEMPRPEVGPDQLLVRARAASLDGWEYQIAGEVEAWGEAVEGFERGDPVFGLAEGGGCAEFCLLDARRVVRVPDGWSFVEAVAVPEDVFWPVVDSVFPLERAAEARERVEAGLNHGKVVLTLAGGASFWGDRPGPVLAKLPVL
jgi:NADPH:quinone reductase-like Zn-dependent oxidoreductase